MQSRSAITLSIVAASLLAVMLWRLLPSRPVVQSQESESRLALPADPDKVAELNATQSSESEREPLAPQETPDVARDGSNSWLSKALLSLFKPSDVSDAVLVVRAVEKTTAKPLSDVRVRVTKKVSEGISFSIGVDGRKGSLGSEPITAKEGEVEFDLPSSCELEVTATGEANDIGTSTLGVAALRNGERRTVTVELQVGKDVEFHGRVLSREDHAPVSGARLVMIQGNSDASSTDEDHDRPEPEILGEAKSDIDGRFEVAAGSWVHPYLQAAATGFGSTFVAVTSNHSSRETERVILLDRGAELDAHVIDAAGAAIPDVKVVASAAGTELLHDEDFASSLDNLWTHAHWVATTSVEGRCVLRDLASGAAISILLRRNDEVLARMGELPALQPGELRRVEWKIGGGCTLKGVVAYGSGKAAPDREVWALPTNKRKGRFITLFDEPDVVTKGVTGPNGEFTLHDLRVGLWLVGLYTDIRVSDTSGPDELVPIGQVVEVLPGQRDKEVIITIPDGLFISGRVVDSTGARARGVKLLANRNQSEIPACKSENDGSFQLGPFRHGSVLIEANLWGSRVEHACITAAAGASDVVIRLSPAARIEGVVVDAASGARCQSELMLSPHPGTSEPLTHIAVEEDGSFEAHNLGAGAYELIAWTNDGRFAVSSDIQIESGAHLQDIVVKLQRAAKLRIRYEGATLVCEVQIQRAGLVVATGGVGRHHPLTQAVPSGMLTVQVYNGFDEPLSRQVELADGEEKEIVLNDDE
jgi:hypothetical protein